MATDCDLGATQPPCPTCGAEQGHEPICGALKASDDMALFGFGVYFRREDGTTEHVPPAEWPAMFDDGGRK